MPFSPDVSLAGRAPIPTPIRTAGARVSNGGVDFRIWAPSASAMQLRCEGYDRDVSMNRDTEGWHDVFIKRATPGTRYRFVLPSGTVVPDPASRFQPEGIHGPSEVIDPNAHSWEDADWTGRLWAEAVVYELHVGAFTAEGTFLAALEKLDHLVDLGITCINLMPVAQFPGQRNWGYDGVFLFAPACAYGRPEHLKQFVDAAHRRGLMVILDVVYNHFGPDGNLIPKYAPHFFTDRHQTPWGDAVNFDRDGSAAVRDFAVQNALYWIEEFHLDGLRLDAVHEIFDDSPRHILVELADRVRDAYSPRNIHLIIENESNRASRLVRDVDGVPKQYTAQWNDDVHHVLHTALTGETDSYYADFQGSSEKLGRALAEGFAFQGERMQSTGSARGEPATHLPPVAFVSFLQNHDQVGNRAMGQRIHSLVPAAASRAATAAYMLLPQIPMLFMGEEWATQQPFPFFCDFQYETGQRVRAGRREEFANFAAFKSPAAREKIADPQAAATFECAKLRWTERQQAKHADWLDWYKRLIEVRKIEVAPIIEQIQTAGTFEVLAASCVRVRFSAPSGEPLLILEANLSPAPCKCVAGAPGRVIWIEGPPAAVDELPPWYVRWTRSV